MDKVIVSVVIPAYNCSQYINQALDSVLIQDVPLEVIVIDDFSTDNLDNAIKSYLSDPRVRYVKNEKNLGVSLTRNKGISLSRGEYVAFLDSDDFWAPEKLKKQLVRLKETGCVLCSTARELINPNGTPSGYIIPVEEDFNFASLHFGNPINCSSVLLRTDIAKEFPMQHDDCHEDYLMWLRILQKYGKGCAINEPLLKYRISNTGKSGNKLHSAMLTFRTYRHMGYGFLRSLLHFCLYAFSSLRKYFRWFFSTKYRY